MSGTSAAAPLVTFTAAVLQAMGLSSPKEIRRRILATADVDDKLAGDGKVAGGRVLNINTALDVFADYIWLNGSDEPRRVHLSRADGDGTKPVLIQLCEPDSGVLNRSRGIVDVAALVYWQREAQTGEAELWHRLNS